MLIGACFNDDRGTQSGSAYIFTLDNSAQGWKHEAVIIGNDTTEYDYFGWSVAVVNGWALVGSWQDDDNGQNSGSAYFFQRKKTSSGNVWNQFEKVYAKNSAENDFFGLSVAMTNDGTALIGAPGRTTDGMANAGVVSVYKRYQDYWYLEDTLQSSETYANDYFGISVGVHGDYAVVGAYGNDPGPGEETGAAFVFMRVSANTWNLMMKLTASDAAANDFFGRSVAIFGSTIVVGADGNDDAGSSSGSAYVFEYVSPKTWSETQKLLPPIAHEYDYFGVSVGIANGSILIGADGTTHNGGKLTGSAWYFERDYKDGQWNAILQMNASDNNPYDLYGSSVSMYKTSLLVGAEMGNGYRYDTGAAYVYTVPPGSDGKMKSSSALGVGRYALVACFAILPLIGLAWWAYRTNSFSFQDLDTSSNSVDNSKTGLTSGFWWTKQSEMDVTVDSKTGLNARELAMRDKETEGASHFDSEQDSEDSGHVFSTSAFNREESEDRK
eukprot:CAMPEP_0182428488 /NCGR_PEP_ID=MMETSP1167-20130531/23057_1 /TAXON_ID=2988 /ORGANISM="Mallomonas Sp, Strain CCMP3275" /LENGTH=496 /DNA_ID=CAMNT_0024611423 /DNA_START=326 /DNA_END=1816 /DNA_ORIENTATION=+